MATAQLLEIEANTDAWHQARSTRIGASELAAAIGKSHYQTPLELYARKTGQLAPIDETLPMKRGRAVEPMIAAEAAEQLGVPILRYPCPALIDPAHPWLIVTPDCELANHEGVECKKTNWRTARLYLGEEGTDNALDEHVIQAQAQMAVTGWPRVHVAVLVDLESPVRIFPVERHEALIAKLLKAGREFAERVADRRPPEPNWEHESTPEIVRALHEIAAGKWMVFTREQVAWWQQRQRYEALSKKLHDRAEMFKARCVHAMGDAEIAHMPELGMELVRKETPRKGYTVEPGIVRSIIQRKAKP